MATLKIYEWTMVRNLSQKISICGRDRTMSHWTSLAPASQQSERCTIVQATANAFIESFNGNLRAECLNTYWFMNLADARKKLEAWRKDYNEVRPHSSLGNKSPIMLINHPDEPSPSDVMPPGNSTSGW